VILPSLAALLLAASADPAAPELPAAERFERAAALYRSGDFAGAAAGWEALAADGFTSPALHLDLGNARMRLGRRGLAIASWERALRLDPSDEDARANLSSARADDPDRALAGEPPLLARVAERTGDRLATALFLVPWWALWGAAALRRGRRGPARRALGVAAALAAVLAAAGGTVLLERVRDRRVPLAVVVAAKAPAREGPSGLLREAFVLHEGTRVRIVAAEGERVRVRLEGGLEGWVAGADVEGL
jgi:tetratricopeptide (TPR) repeat protein